MSQLSLAYAEDFIMSVTQLKYNPLRGLIRALLAVRVIKAFELTECLHQR